MLPHFRWQCSLITRPITVYQQIELFVSRMCYSHCHITAFVSVLLENKKMSFNFFPLPQPYVWTGPSISTCSPLMETATEKPSMCIWTYVMMMTSEASWKTLLEGRKCEDQGKTWGGQRWKMKMTEVNDYCSVLETDGENGLRQRIRDVWRSKDFMLGLV